ncbi:LPS assembly lipoprotein LptE [Marinobacter changyiensis]|uniref:LPS-assembly lipoprotein LptE n=1 Tax=Marinobacter changyiensis TaxID=2604091 RepID=UPI001FE9B6AC|nr:LPS assembly lipoprotein LptE [Marinobacter changyiensis]
MTPDRSAKLHPKAIPVALMALYLTGCGFQLRGAPPVSDALQPLAVVCASNIPEDLCNAVKDQLELGDITLVSSEEAAYLLRLNDFSQQRRASAITLEAAAAEYDLRQTVTMDVVTSDQIPLVAEVDVRSSETYRYDETNVLAKQREERELQETLYQRLAQQIIFRLVPLTESRIDVLRDAAEAESKRAEESTQ